MEFFLSWLVGTKVAVDARLKRRDLRWLLVNLLKGSVEGVVKEVESVMSDFRYYRPNHSIWELARKAEEIASLTNQYGEGWLVPGEISALAEDGILNVLCLQPFGCLPNQIVAKGLEKRLKEKYPDLNLLFLDTDAGLSEVNYFNRLHFFVDQARTAAFQAAEPFA
jgi:predicted nucleotide-binding protein (sugar kinase/HSP70/actin superfamily)